MITTTPEAAPPAAMTRSEREAEVERFLAHNARPGVRRFDAANYIRNEEEAAAYLEVAGEEGDPQLLAMAEADVARARARWTAEARR